MRSAWLSLVLLVACDAGALRGVRLLVVDEAGAPVPGASAALGDRVVLGDGAGVVDLGALDGPSSGVISADGYLDEPVVVGIIDDHEAVEVRLWSAQDRWVLHAGGDVMLGRRYAQGEAALLRPGAQAEGAVAVVAHLAPMFRAADLSVVNLETVVAELPDHVAYPGKRYLLQTPPEALQALDEMGVDAVDLANNHARDWMDEGVVATQSALDDRQIAWFGASSTESRSEPWIVQVRGVTIGMIGFATLDGSFVNDSYPVDGDPVPDDLDVAWQYEPRVWGWGEVAPAPRRIGSAWRAYSESLDGLEPKARAAAWRSVVQVYPELQDWVAQRGHGGAHGWDERSAARIEALKSKVDVVVVQIHGGLQFSPGASEFVHEVTRASVRAGADLVVCHHPHVLQGAAYYRGVPIVYSLGNLVFDQDFLSTFAGAWLRTVWEGDTLLEARLLPVEIIDYVPRPVSDGAAERTLRGVWERSDLGGLAGRTDVGNVVVAGEAPADWVPARVRLQRHTGVLEASPGRDRRFDVHVPSGEIVPLTTSGLVDPTLGGSAPDGVSVGRDLVGWGHGDDVVADGLFGAANHFDVRSDDVFVRTSVGGSMLQLERDGFDSTAVQSRLLARVPLTPHRLYSKSLEPIDPVPFYLVRFRAKLFGGGQAGLRLVSYDVDDLDPTRDPSSAEIADVHVPVQVGRRWTQVTVAVDGAWLEGQGLTADMLLPYVTLDPPRVGRSWLRYDDLQVLELRRANAMPSVLGAWDVVHNGGSVAVDVVVDAVE